jgi:hypothetical protein
MTENNDNIEEPRKWPRPGEIPTNPPYLAPDTPVSDKPNMRAKTGPYARPPANDPNFSQHSYASTQDFLRDHRIHVKHGSYFIGPGLALHPEELDPKNEAKLRAKLENTYKFDAPSFYDDHKRAMIGVQLGTLIPASLASERESLMRHIGGFNEKLSHGVSEQAFEAASYHIPMQATAEELAQESQEIDPLGLEYATNGVAFYLLLREAMTRKGFGKILTDYIDHADSPNQVLNDITDKLGLDVRSLRETALGGISAVANALDIDDATREDIVNISQYVSEHHFSLNAIEHWHIGRQIKPEGSVEEKIAAGKPARIDHDIKEFRKLANGQYNVPETIRAQEETVANALSLIEPAERDVLYRLGYQIGYTPDRVADSIAEFPGILGLHRKLANDLRDIDGNYYIYFAGQLDEKKALRTLRHEIAHNLWPARFSDEDRQQIDGLMEQDNTRLQALKTLTTTHKDSLQKFVSAYLVSDAAEKTAVIGAANDYFADLGLKFDDILPHLKGVEQLSWMVSEAHSKLRVDGEFYNKTAYLGATVRFREMISRYSELQYVAHREQPDMQAMLQFVVPGMHEAFNDHYLPHIEQLRAELINPDLAPKASDNPRIQFADNPGKEPKNPPLPVAAERPSTSKENRSHQQPETGDDLGDNMSLKPKNTVAGGDIQYAARISATKSALSGLGIGERASQPSSGAIR